MKVETEVVEGEEEVCRSDIFAKHLTDRSC